VPEKRAGLSPKGRSGCAAGERGHQGRYLAAAQSFASYLLEVGILSANPPRDVSAPPANNSRCTFLELPDVVRLVEGARPPFQTIFALAYGASLEISAILALVDTDLDPAARQVRARGTLQAGH
jgi:site-specific recombinase XerC